MIIPIYTSYIILRSEITVLALTRSLFVSTVLSKIVKPKGVYVGSWTIFSNHRDIFSSIDQLNYNYHKNNGWYIGQYAKLRWVFKYILARRRSQPIKTTLPFSANQRANLKHQFENSSKDRLIDLWTSFCLHWPHTILNNLKINEW